MDLDNDLLDEMELWLNKKTLRNTRHRRMLQAEWERAARAGKVNSETTFSDLYSFEQAVASIEFQSQHLIARGVTSHATTYSKADLLRLEERGWNITELLQLLDEQPDVFFQQFPKAIEAMSRIQSTQRRIANLDWRRDVNRAGEVALQVRNPLQLVRIEQQIPALIRHLAERDIEDETFTYTAWIPEQRPVLVPREQSLIRKVPAKVQPQSTLEEAHEAMLESMESEEHVREDEIKEKQEFVEPVKTTLLSTTKEADKIRERKEDNTEEKSKTVAAPGSTSVVEGDLTSYERL